LAVKEKFTAAQGSLPSVPEKKGFKKTSGVTQLPFAAAAAAPPPPPPLLAAAAAHALRNINE